MKTTKTIILLLALNAMVVASCKKKSKEEETTMAPASGPPSVSAGTFTAKVNGTNVVYNSSFYMQNGIGGVMTTSVNGIGGSDGIFLIFTDIGNTVTLGTKNIDGASVTAHYDVAGTQNIATSGTITITAFGNDKISGTFSFSGGGYTITNGVFADVLRM